MQNLILFTLKDRNTILKARKGESKFGEHIQLIPNLTNIYDDIVNLDVDYVLFGIREDIGVYANCGKTGTYKAWDTALKFLLNIQNNSFTTAKRVLILGFSVLKKISVFMQITVIQALTKLGRLL